MIETLVGVTAHLWSVTVSICLYCLCLSVPFNVCLEQSLLVSDCFCVSVTVSVCLWLPLSLCDCMCLYVAGSVCNFLCRLLSVTVSVFFSVTFAPCFSFSVYDCPCLSKTVSIRLYVVNICLWLSLSVCDCLCLYLTVCDCLCLSPDLARAQGLWKV